MHFVCRARAQYGIIIGNNLKLPANYVLVYILNSEDKRAEICSKITKNVIKIFNVNNGRSVFDFTPIEFIEIQDIVALHKFILQKNIMLISQILRY